MRKYLIFNLLLLLVVTTQAQMRHSKEGDVYTLTVNYYYEGTQATAAPDTVLRLEENAVYSIVSPTIPGFTPDRPIVEGKMPASDLTETVFYSVSQYIVATISNPVVGGTTTGDGTYEHGSQVTVSATAKPGFSFVKWTDNNGDVSNQAQYSFIVTANRLLVANFIENTHAVIVDPNITHGTVTVSPSGNVSVGATVSVTANPDTYYELTSLRAFNNDNENQTVTIENNSFTMPNFDVKVTASFALQLPVITGAIGAPQPICSGDVLTLTTPTVANADAQGWQMAPDATFSSIVAYTGQALDGTHNGWKLRYMASNATGTVYSNVVNITVNVLEPTLAGELSLCTMQTGTYIPNGVGNATLTWTVSDAAATLTETGKTLKVVWATAGQQTITLKADNEDTGCSATVSLTVNVQSYINSGDLKNIVAKKHDGKEYILIYPNPKDTYKYQWYKDGIAIRGANGQYYYQTGGLDAGVYKVYLSYNADANGNLFGGAFSGEYTVAAPAKLNLCPNPAKTGEGIVVTNECETEGIVSVYSLDGRLLHKQKVNGTQTTLDIDLAKGMYIVKFTDAQNNETTEKLVVK